MSKILVTGGAGFIGYNLIKRLKKEGHTITCIDDYSSGSVNNHIKGVEYIKIETKEINNLPLDMDDFHGFNVVFHLGEYSRIATSYDEINKVWYANSLGTYEVVNYCKLNNVKIVYAGSSTRFAEEGANHSPYSFTKSKSADLIKNYSKWYGLKYTICYFYNVFGDRYDSAPVPGYESVISVFEKQYKANKSLTICGNGLQRRAFTYVDDVVDGLIKAWKYDKNEEFQLNNPKEFTILEIAKMFSDNIEHIDGRPGDRSASVTTNNNARELLGWEATMGVTEWIKNIKNEEG